MEHHVQGMLKRDSSQVHSTGLCHLSALFTTSYGMILKTHNCHRRFGWHFVLRISAPPPPVCNSRCDVRTAWPLCSPISEEFPNRAQIHAASTSLLAKVCRLQCRKSLRPDSKAANAATDLSALARTAVVVAANFPDGESDPFSIGSATALTQGASGRNFASAGAGTCKAGQV